MKRKIYITFLAMALIFISYSNSQAVSTYLNQFNTRYGTSTTALNTCSLCHTSVPARNTYGAAFAANGHNFATIESLDSDGDTFTNITEINARFFPGDAASHPAPATDTTAPNVTAFTMPATATSLTVSVTSFTATDAVGVTGYLLTESSTAPAAGAAGWSATAPSNFTFTSPGAKTLFAWAKDAAGNVSASLSDSVTITLPDTTAPTVTAFTMPATATSLTVAITSFTATDAVGVTGYLLTESSTAPAAGAAGWSATAPSNFTFTSAGAHTLFAWARDAAGNVSASLSAAVTINIPDNTAPTVTTFTIPSAATSLTVSITTFTATDNVGVAGYLLTETTTAPAAGAAGWSATAPTSYTFASAGAHNLFAWAKDAAGNVSASQNASVTITLDTAAPNVTGFSIPATATSLTVAVTNFNATDNVAVTGYLLTETATVPAANAAGWSATAPTSYAFTTDGAKTLFAWVKDAAGNVSASQSASVTITLPDATAPVVTAFAIPATATSLIVSITTFTATDNVGVTGYMTTETATAPLANAVGWSATAPASHTFAGPGPKSLYAWAKDAVGNVSASSSATVTITLSAMMVDAMPAKTMLVAGMGHTFTANGGTNGPNMMFSLQGPAGGSIDPQTGQFTTQPQNSAGIYTLTVTDMMSGAISSPMKFAVRVKTDPAASSIMMNNEMPLLASGGTAPYTCSADITTVVQVTSVNDGCMVTGLKPGIANIMIKDANDTDPANPYFGKSRVVVFEGGLISGKVVDSSLAGIDTAIIRVIETGDSTGTNADGSFQISLPLGVYTLSIADLSRVNIIKNVTLDQTHLTQDLGQVIMVDAQVSIIGAVVDLTGFPVSDANIFVMSADPAGKPVLIAAEQSDLQGNFAIYPATAGNYLMMVTKAGYGSSALQSFSTGGEFVELTLTMVVSSFESGDPRVTTIIIADSGALFDSPTVTLLPGQGNGSLSVVDLNADDNWELTYTPASPDTDGDLIGIKIEPLGAGAGFEQNYFFTINPTLTVKLPSKVTQSIFTAGMMVVGQPVGQVEANGQIIDANDQTSFMISSQNMTTATGITRSMEVTRYEVPNSSAQQAILGAGVTPMSAVYDFAFVDPTTGIEQGQEIKQITLKIKVDLAVFDPDPTKWAIMISHDPTGPNPAWQFIQPVPGTSHFDGQYLSFDLTTLYGQGVVITSPASQAPGADTTGSGGGGGGGGCFIATAAFGSPLIGFGQIMLMTTTMQKLAILIGLMTLLVGIGLVYSRIRVSQL